MTQSQNTTRRIFSCNDGYCIRLYNVTRDEIDKIQEALCSLGVDVHSDFTSNHIPYAQIIIGNNTLQKVKSSAEERPSETLQTFCDNYLHAFVHNAC